MTSGAAVRRSEAAGDFGSQKLEVAGVPGEDGIGTGLYGASRDERIVDGAADDSVRGGIPNRGQIDIAVKADEAESAAHALQELDGLVRCDAMRRRNAREGGEISARLCEAQKAASGVQRL